MSRIRSIHPGQWTDEDFVECSFPARLLALGVRNEADDNGIFDWKPITLKMKLFPADAVDVSTLLAELETSGQIMKYEIDGRSYGAIKNFRIYQSPKAPKSMFPMTDDAEDFVGYSRGQNATTARLPGRPRKAQIGENKPVYDKSIPQNGENNCGEDKSFPKNGEKYSQRERGGEDNNNNKHPTTDSARSDFPKTEPEKPNAEDRAIDELERNAHRRPPPTPATAAKSQQPFGSMDPKLAKIVAAGWFSMPPTDWKTQLDAWEKVGADLEKTVIPAIREVAERLERTGQRQPFKLKFYDSAVRQALAAELAENQRFAEFAAAHDGKFFEPKDVE